MTHLVPLEGTTPVSLTPEQRLGDAYVKMWGAYQTLAIEFHRVTKHLESRIRELEAK